MRAEIVAMIICRLIFVDGLIVLSFKREVKRQRERERGMTSWERWQRERRGTKDKELLRETYGRV